MLAIERPHQIWCTDITDHRLAHRFVYLTAVMNRYSRNVMSWEVSVTMPVAFCINVLLGVLHGFWPTDDGVKTLIHSLLPLHRACPHPKQSSSAAQSPPTFYISFGVRFCIDGEVHLKQFNYRVVEPTGLALPQPGLYPLSSHQQT